jgi:hypothetical protein
LYWPTWADGCQHIANITSNPSGEFIVSVARLAFVLLPEFDNDGVFSAPIIASGYEAIQSARCERQLILEYYPISQEIAFLENLCDGSKRIAPGIYFVWRGFKTKFLKEGVAQLARDPIFRGVIDQACGRSRIQSHRASPSKTHKPTASMARCEDKTSIVTVGPPLEISKVNTGFGGC